MVTPDGHDCSSSNQIYENEEAAGMGVAASAAVSAAAEATGGRMGSSCREIYDHEHSLHVST